MGSVFEGDPLVQAHQLIQPIDYVVIATYIVVLLAIGLYVGLRQGKDANLFLAGRSMGWANVGMSIWGTNIGPSFLIASFGAAYSSGMLVANFEWAAWIFLALLAMVFTPYYLNLNIETIPQIIKRRFGDRMYRIMTIYSLFTIILIWLGGVLFSGGLLLSQMLGWPISTSIILLITIATSFTVVGGLAAVIVTDSFQTILMIIGMASLTFIGISEVGGIENLIASTPPEYWVLMDSTSEELPIMAFVVGYPIMAVWFWCTDQTIVQRMFAARDLPTAQKGALLAAFLKILPPFLFIIPGIVFFALQPGLEHSDEAFLAMVTNYMPTGFKGLMIAVLIAALISTVDSGLNSFSTVFTLDIYVPIFAKGREVPVKETRLVGRIVTLAAGVFACFWAIMMESFTADLFNLLQSMIAFLAPPLTTLFLFGLFWKRVTTTGAMWGFIVSCFTCVTIGYSSMKGITYGLVEAWPHFLWLSFILFIFSSAITVGISLCTGHSDHERFFPALSEIYKKSGNPSRSIWINWIVLGIIMVCIYAGFEYLGARTKAMNSDHATAAKEGPWPSNVSVYRGSTPVFDGEIGPDEYQDATQIDGVEGWNPQFSAVTDPADLSAKVWIKHDVDYLYFAFDVVDDRLYGFDTERWLPDENPKAHELTREGFPWFGDGVEVLINAEYKWRQMDYEYNKGNGSSWQMVVSTHKSRLGGVGTGGLMEGEQRDMLSAWQTYQEWILNGDMEAKVHIKTAEEGKGYTIELRVKPDPCLEVSNGQFWSPELGIVKMGLNLTVADLDRRIDGQGNWGNFHHENWWAGERDKRTWLKQWGTMTLYPGYREASH